jgi:hypothetical protein
MKKNNKASARRGSPCLCQGAGPTLTEMIRRMAPPPEARRHFESARVEFLKGLRTLIDARIERRSRPKARGQSINVE